MVKIPRIHKQYTAVPSRSELTQHLPAGHCHKAAGGRSLSLWVTGKSAPPTAILHFIQLAPPPPHFPKTVFPKINSLWIQQPYYAGWGEDGRPPIFCHLLEKHILVSNSVFENHRINMQQQL